MSTPFNDREAGGSASKKHNSSVNQGNGAPPFKVSILAADCAFYEGECESLTVPTLDGLYGILANHSNMIAAVVPGTLTYRLPGGENQIAAVSAGLVKVESNEVLVLVDSVERPEDIDENRARRALEEAKEAMLQKKSIVEYRSAQAHLARAISRLRVKGNSIKK